MFGGSCRFVLKSWITRTLTYYDLQLVFLIGVVLSKICPYRKYSGGGIKNFKTSLYVFAALISLVGLFVYMFDMYVPTRIKQPKSPSGSITKIEAR